MPDLDKILLFRMMHIENIPHVLQHGITHKDSPNANPSFLPIGDSALINTRTNFLLDNGRRLGEYIPFYFGIRTPMLYVVQKGYNLVQPTPPENIIYCVSSVQKIINNNHEFIFTDGHAVDSFSTQYYTKDVENIETIVDHKAIMAKYWKDEKDLDLKRRKEAEFLVLGDIDTSALLGYCVFNQHSKDILLGYGVAEADIRIKPQFYF